MGETIRQQKLCFLKPAEAITLALLPKRVASDLEPKRNTDGEPQFNQPQGG